MGKIRGFDQFVGCITFAAVLRISGVRLQPITKGPQFAGTGIGTELIVVHEPPHHVVVLFEHPCVPRAQIDLPGDDGRCVGPAAARVLATVVRHDERNAAILELVLSRALQPTCPEGMNIRIEDGSWREDLRIARPAHPLIALRAVRRDVEEVAVEAPGDIAL